MGGTYGVLAKATRRPCMPCGPVVCSFAGSTYEFGPMRHSSSSSCSSGLPRTIADGLAALIAFSGFRLKGCTCVTLYVPGPTSEPVDPGQKASGRPDWGFESLPEGTGHLRPWGGHSA